MKLPLHTLAVLALAARVLGAPPDAPTQLRVNELVSPIGTANTVHYGWLVHDADDHEVQSAFQLLVASSAEHLANDCGDIWDSRKTVSGQQSHIVHAGNELVAETRYHWKVRTWDKDDQPGPWSAPATFAVGLLEQRDWAGAKWIRRHSDDPDDYSQFRRRFEVASSPIVRATAYVSAAHRYVLYLNGTRVGHGQADHHPQFQYYHAHDVTALLEAGARNQLAVFTHWFGGGQGRPASARGLLVKLIVHHADGTRATLGTDDLWKTQRADAWVTDRPVHRNPGEGVGYVERIDGQRASSSWLDLTFDDSAWLAAEIIGAHPTEPWSGQLAPDPVHLVERTIPPAQIHAKGNGNYVVDFGRVYAGRPRIRFSGGRPGELVSMRGGFTLENGELPIGRAAQDTNLDYFAHLSGHDFVFEPAEYLGWRYFQIDRAPMEVTTENIELIARHAPLDEGASSFVSSSPTLNAVWALMKHSLFTCAQETFVDTPTREKGGFLGDAVIQSSVAMPVLHERVLTRRVLGEFLQSMDQHWSAPADRGRINAVYPNNDGARDIPDYTQSYLDWARAYYLETGDRAFLAEHAARLEEIGNYVWRHIDLKSGLVTRLTGGRGAYEHGIIDWPASMRFGYNMSTVARTVINARAYAAFETLAYFAEQLNRSAERDRWLARSLALRDAINRQLCRADGVYHDGLRADGTPSPHASQHANVYPLALGLVPAEHKDTVTKHVVAQGMRVGMITVPWLIRALGESDQGAALLDLLTNENQPGWARILARGGTATWESWDADTNNDSMSHAWGAGGLEAYTRYLLGVRLLRPQAEHVHIQPLEFGEQLGWVRGHLTTQRGVIAVEWHRSAADYRLRVSIPVNVTAQLAIPRGEAAHPAVQLNGVSVNFTVDGDYLVVEGIGSGEHIVTRTP